MGCFREYIENHAHARIVRGTAVRTNKECKTLDFANQYYFFRSRRKKQSIIWHYSRDIYIYIYTTCRTKQTATENGVFRRTFYWKVCTLCAELLLHNGMPCCSLPENGNSRVFPDWERISWRRGDDVRLRHSAGKIYTILGTKYAYEVHAASMSTVYTNMWYWFDRSAAYTKNIWAGWVVVRWYVRFHIYTTRSLRDFSSKTSVFLNIKFEVLI